ncbi:unnamed protein product [Absidia cylindrospora]
MTDRDREIARAIGMEKYQYNLSSHQSQRCAILPRYSFFPLITPQLITHVNKLQASEPHSIWYEYDGEPLKWHYPIGLLYDMVTRMRPSSSARQLPWRILVHNENFPETVLLRNPGIETIQDMYMSMIKEADFLRHGSTKKVMNLSKQDQSQLWHALSTERYDDHWNVNQHILDDRGAGLRSVPIRLYLPDQCPVIQDTASFTDDIGDLLTLGDVLKTIVPGLIVKGDTTKEPDFIVVSHGIELSLHTPIRWASDHLSYPDNFLHIIICRPLSSSSSPSL